jgi:small-conductance mechanosensitive channel
VGGDKPIGLVIAAIVVGAVLAMPLMVVSGFYLFASVYAIIAGSDFGSETINVGAFLTGLVLTVAAGLVAMAVVVSLIGRVLSPKRRHA